MIETDILIVGAGPAGLATAIALLRKAKGNKPRVVVLDKGRSPGSHVLSGAIVDPSGRRALLTDEEIAQMPCEAKVCRESFRCNFTSKLSIKIPWVPALLCLRKLLQGRFPRAGPPQGLPPQWHVPYVPPAIGILQREGTCVCAFPSGKHLPTDCTI